LTDTKLPNHPAALPATRKVTLLGLIAATYFMVAGGPYGLEDVVREAGYLGAIGLLFLVPFLWSLPTTLMISELSSTLPEEGGYYAWVRRALGPFWGFQEAWLSLAASLFDMAIYPILFVTYLGYTGRQAAPLLAALGLPSGDAGFWQSLASGETSLTRFLIGTAMIAGCTLLNLRPARSVGRSALLLAVILLGPFAVLTALALFAPHAPAEVSATPTETDFVTALLFALCNYMGWDNASTIAGEVDRPQRTYPLTMGGAVLLVTLTYILPVMAAARTGVPASDWKSGSWVTLGEVVGGAALAVAVGAGGMTMGFGTFNSLVLSYSRVPAVMAEDGYLPAVFARRLRSGAPWVAVLACAVAWGLASQLGLRRVLALDVILYGLALLLEFAALVALRVREPNLPRPFRVPGGLNMAVLLSLFPALLIGLAVFHQARLWAPEEGETLAPAQALLLGVGLAALGPVLYLITSPKASVRRGSE
jgi:amino acid transporter